jgi:hypothetical protein
MSICSVIPSSSPSQIGHQQANAGKDSRKKNPNTLMVRMQISAVTMETNTMEVPQKTKS